MPPQGDYTYHVHENGTAEITAYTGSEKVCAYLSNWADTPLQPSAMLVSGQLEADLR